MNSYFEQGGFYGGGSGGDQAYRFPLGLSVSPYGQPGPRQDGYDTTAASCKLYAPPQEHMTPNPFKVDCVKDQNGYGATKDMSGGWGPAVRPACTPDPVAARGYPPDPSTSPRDRAAHVGGWNTCGMTPVSQPHQQSQQPPQQTNNQMNQAPSNTTFYPWMAIAGTYQASDSTVVWAWWRAVAPVPPTASKVSDGATAVPPPGAPAGQCGTRGLPAGRAARVVPGLHAKPFPKD